ncbi:MAG: hypothetical protein ACFCVF_07185 [Kineosporiaceae bacterium]
MRKALATVLLSATALAAGFAGAIAPAAADSTPEDSPSAECIPADEARFDGRWNVAGPGLLSATLRGAADSELCDDVALNASVYLVPDTWDGGGFNETAVPQTLVPEGHAPDLVFPTGTAVGTELTADVTAFLPECANYQVDLYTGAKLDEVGPGGHGGAFITGGLVKGDLDAPECDEPTESPSTEPSTESSTEPTTPTEPATTEPTEPSETEPTEPTETTPATTTPTSATTTQVAGTTTVASTSQGPELAFTGSSGTSALVGVALLLVVGGAVALVLTHRRRLGATHQG